MRARRADGTSSCASRSHRSTPPSATSTATSASILETIGARAGARARAHALPRARAHRLPARGPAAQGALRRGPTSRRSSWSRRRAARRRSSASSTASATTLYNAVALCGNGTVLQTLPQAPAAQLRRLRRGALLRAGRGAGAHRARRDDVRRTPSARTSGCPSSPPRPPRWARRSSSTSRRRRFTPARAPSARRCCASARARQRRVARVLQPRRRPGRARLRRPQRRHLARRARSSRAARRSRRTSSSPTSRPGAQLGASADLAPELGGRARRSTRRSSSGCATTCARTASPTSCSACPGGIDSALTAAIAADALGAEHVHGVHDAEPLLVAGQRRRLGRARRGARHRDAGAARSSRPFEAFLDTLAPAFDGREPDVAEENLQARVRGTLLMALSNKFGWLDAGDRQQERAVGGLLDALRRHGRRVRAASRTSSRRASTSSRAGATRRARRRSSRRRSSTRRPAPSCGPTSVDQDSLPPYADARRDPDALRRARREPRRRSSATGFDPRDGRPGHPADRHRRVQAPAGPARRQDHRQGVRQGPPDAGHEPLRRLSGSVTRLHASSSSTHDWHRFDEVLDLSYDVLYRAVRRAARGRLVPPGPRQRVRRRARRRTARCSGTARLLPAPGDAARQVRQVAVSARRARRAESGSALMLELERVAAAEGAVETVAPRARAPPSASTSGSGYVPEGDDVRERADRHPAPHDAQAARLGAHARDSLARDGSVRVPCSMVSNGCAALFRGRVRVCHRTV